jgi:hypothetical protein
VIEGAPRRDASHHGTREDEHLLFPIGIEAIGKPSHQIVGQDAMTGLGQRGKSAAHDLLPGLAKLQPPSALGRCPEPAPALDDRRGDPFRRERCKVAGNSLATVCQASSGQA